MKNKFELDIVNNFINNNIKTNDIHELSKLNDFFNLKKYKVDTDNYINIIKTNKKISEIISNYIGKDINTIDIEFYRKTINENIIINLIEIYCYINNIEIKDVDLSIDEDDLEYDDTNEIDSVKSYIRETKKYKVLSKEEQKELVKKALNGDEYSRNKLIEHNQRLVISIAHKYIGKGLDFMDLIQTGNIGLMKAIDKYDIERETAFSTYATYWIRQCINREIYNHGRNVRIPIHIIEQLSKLNKAYNILSQELDRNPTIEEVAEYLKMEISRVKKLMGLNSDTVSLNQKIGNDIDSSELGDFIPSSNEQDELTITIKNQEIMSLLENANLTNKEKEVISLLYGFDGKGPKRLEEVGKKLGCTRERVRQLKEKSLRKIRLSKNIEDFAVYMQDVDGALQNIRECKNGLKIKKQEKQEASVARKTNNIYELLNENNKDYINMVIEQLTAAEKNIVKLRYGDDLDNPTISDNWNGNISYRFCYTIVPKMKKILKKLKENEQESEDLIIKSQLDEASVKEDKNEIKPLSTDDKITKIDKEEEINKFENHQEINDNLRQKTEEEEILEITKNILELYKINLNRCIDAVLDINDSEIKVLKKQL